MEIKREDLNDLSIILDELNKGRLVDRDFMISSGLIENNLNNREKTREIARLRLNYLIPVLEYYCAVKQKLGIAFELYMVKPDINKTAGFYANGGFKSEYDRQQKDKIKEIEKESLSMKIDRLTIENLELQNSESRYKEKIRTQESIIRWWQVATAIFGFISMLLALLAFFL